MEASYAYQLAIEREEKIVVGVNKYQVEDEQPMDILSISDELADEQIASLEAVRSRRDDGAVANTLDRLKQGAEGDANTMPLILDCVKAYASVGEISDALRDAFGTWEEPAAY